MVTGRDGDLLHIETEERPEGTVARVSGEVDLANVDHLKQAIQPVLRNGRNVILDLSHLRYIDSTGLYVLAYAHKALQQHNCQLVVVGASPTITKILRIFGLDGLAPRVSSLDEAMNLLRTRSSGTAANE